MAEGSTGGTGGAIARSSTAPIITGNDNPSSDSAGRNSDSHGPATVQTANTSSKPGSLRTSQTFPLGMFFVAALAILSVAEQSSPTPGLQSSPAVSQDIHSLVHLHRLTSFCHLLTVFWFSLLVSPSLPGHKSPSFQSSTRNPTPTALSFFEANADSSAIDPLSRVSAR